GYHQSAVGHLSPFIHECRTYYLNSRITVLTCSRRRGLAALSKADFFTVSYTASWIEQKKEVR
ncbi:hypothetical protein, partial [Aeromonas rivipollensis]|uniref:hypothetical protein n=1 Tax=Aeromonas rivipollensis TaxID=948519 RepID=UPI003D1E943B